MAVKSFHELIVWQKAMTFVEQVYQLSADLTGQPVDFFLGKADSG